MRDHRKALAEALADASGQYVDLLGEPFAVTVVSDVTDSPKFWAIAELKADHLAVTVTRGLLEAIETLWDSATEP